MRDALETTWNMNWNSLPELLRRKDVMAMGISERQYYSLLAACPQLIVKVPGYKRERKVHKGLLLKLISPQ